GQHFAGLFIGAFMDVATITGLLSLLTLIVLVLSGVVLYLSVKLLALKNTVIQMKEQIKQGALCDSNTDTH
uniref:hypothetical protein n=2 Tax=unclassified Pseudoalteromonas TaxID=194690 RepID=UPI00332E2819